MDSFVALVHSHSPELVDGVGGIIKAIGDRFAHSTDIRLFAEDLLRQPVTVAVLPGNEGGKNILLAGEASNARTIETWAAALASAMTPGIVRTERFFKENTRKDIIAATENVRAELEPIGDFAVSRLGASGGNVVIFIAHRGRQFVASTDAGLLRTVLEMNQKPPSGSVTKEEWGTADLPWLLSFIESVAGNAGKEVRTLSDALLGSDLWRVRWQLTRRPDTDRFHWSVQRSSVPPASGHGTTGKR